MRSDRDIKRAPRRPLPGTPLAPDADPRQPQARPAPPRAPADTDAGERAAPPQDGPSSSNATGRPAPEVRYAPRSEPSWQQRPPERRDRRDPRDPRDAQRPPARPGPGPRDGWDTRPSGPPPRRAEGPWDTPRAPHPGGPAPRRNEGPWQDRPTDRPRDARPAGPHGSGRPPHPQSSDRPPRQHGFPPATRWEQAPGGSYDAQGPRRDAGRRDDRRLGGPGAVPHPDAQRPLPNRPRPLADAPREGVRLSKVRTDRGVASRREADDWIAAGWVRIGGEMAVLGQRVAPDVHIDIDPAARQNQARQVTILLHKPIGYVSGQAEDGYEPASVLVTAANLWAEDPSRKPFHPGQARGLAPAGRLDIDSTGLLVLTQDGRIAKHLIGENSDVEKEYLVRVEPLEGFPPLAELRLSHLESGLSLDGKQLKPAKVSWANEDQLRFVLKEGRKRQIRRMCELVGLKVTGLKRVRIGSVVLGKLPLGQWRFLRDSERF